MANGGDVSAPARGLLLVIHKFDRRAGPDSLVLGLLSRLSRARWRPCVLQIDFGRAPGPSLLQEARPDDVPLKILPWSGGRSLPRIAYAIARLVAMRNIAVVHSHDIPSHLAVRLARPLLRPPLRALIGPREGRSTVTPACVASVHGLVDQTPRQRLWNRINQRVLPSFERVVIGSPAMAAPFAFIAPQRIDLVWNAVDTDCLPPRPPPLRAPTDPLHLLCIARLSAEKGHAVLIDALRQARAAGVDARLRLVGTGPMEADIRAEVARHGLGPYVWIEGFVPDIGDALAACNLVVLPSVQESLPLVVLEAMARQIPVLSTDAGALPQVVEHGVSGLVVRAGDPAALAAGIARAANEPARLSEMAARGRERALARHSLSAFVAATEACYLRALQRS